MRVLTSKSKNAISYYVQRSIYLNKKHTTQIVEKLGTEKYIQETYGVEDAYAWAKSYVAELNRLEKEGQEPKVILELDPSTQVAANTRSRVNCGYLFLQKIYHELGIDKIAKDISNKYKIEYDLNHILSRLLYSRMIYPGSKLSTYQASDKYIEPKKFDLHQIYRALDVISNESDFIQSSLYKNSLSVTKRNTSVLYYDCTNFFFEIEEASGIRQYGHSKENRPNPIVQMGLFMDSDGIPVAFHITSGNTNEQTTLKPLEKQIIKDFELSKFVVCTDAGLSSQANRVFNTIHNRAFITTQSLKKLKAHIKKWALDTKGWKLEGSKNTFDISDIAEEKYFNRIFTKERWINENGLEQRLIVTYSIKYKNYQRQIRNGQIERAAKLLHANPGKLNTTRANDSKRFITKTHVTPDGEVCDKTFYGIDNEKIQQEETYDGFYGVCTNLEDSTFEIANINKRRWEIEESFRIMKSEFEARPVHLSRDNRIKAHFMTCFISLMMYRILEKKLDNKYTCNQILDTLKDMELLDIKGKGLLPAYNPTALTNDLHDTAGFRTDYEVISHKRMKNILKASKS